MLGRFGPALALICLLVSGAARAGPLTFYADPPLPTAENDWLAAISGSTIWSPYPYDVTIIDRSIFPAIEIVSGSQLLHRFKSDHHSNRRASHLDPGNVFRD